MDGDVLGKGGIEFRLENDILREYTLVYEGSINTVVDD
jgi:hypothetical protein